MCSRTCVLSWGRGTLLLLLFLGCGAGLFGQVGLVGRVVGGDNEEVVTFATVVLRVSSDTVRHRTAVTDMRGGYRFDSVAPGSYSLLVSALGYEALRTEVIVPDTLSSGTEIKRVDTLHVSVVGVEEVRVGGRKQGQTADKKEFTFSKEKIKAALTSLDLLKGLPFIREDQISDQLKTIDNQSVVLLINGISSSYNDVRSLPKDKIKRVDRYDIAPIRYRDAGVVLDIITEPLDDALNAGIHANSAVTTGFVNGGVYLSFMRGKHKFNVNYNANYRNYGNREQQLLYEYNLGGMDYRLWYDRRGAFGYFSNFIRLSYTYFPSDKTHVEVRLNGFFNPSFFRNNLTGFYNHGLQQDTISGSDNFKENLIQPSLDLYVSHKITDRDEILVNLVGNHFLVKSHGRTHEENVTQGQTFISDDRYLDNTKYSVIGEATYSRQLSFAKLNVGYRASYAGLHSNQTNQFGRFDYRSSYFDQHLYSSLSGVWRSFNYRLSLGGKHYKNLTDGVSYETLQFVPQVILGVSLPYEQALRLVYQLSNGVPGINSLSPSVSMASYDIYQTGNPYLKNSLTNRVSLIYTLDNRWVDLKVSGRYVYQSRPIMDYYKEEGGRLWNLYVNGLWTMQGGGSLTATVKPFGNDMLQLSLYFNPTYYRLKSDQRNYGEWNFENYAYVQFNYKGFGASWYYVYPVMLLYGNGLRTMTENNHSVSAWYRWSGWTFSAAVHFIGTPSHYVTESLPGDRVLYRHETNIHANNTMATIGVAYHFEMGKMKSVRRGLNNQDGEAPTK